MVTEKRARTSRTRKWTSKDWTDMQHTGPDTLAGQYMRRFWHPVYAGEELPIGEPQPIRIMSEDFTLYRGESGEVHIVDSACAHQSTQLSIGWVEGENIRCFFHGWVYDGDGQCIEQPGEWAPFCEKIRIRSLPVQEYLGLIFAYLGDGEPPPLPRYADMEEEGIRIVEWYSRECNYSQDFEPKPIHGGYTHSHHSHGEPFLPRRVPSHVSAEETDWGFTTYATHENGVKAKPYGMPNVHHVLSPPHWGAGWVDSLVHIVPIDDEHMLSFSVELVRLTGEAAEEYLERRGPSKPSRPIDHELVKLILAGKVRLKDVDPESIDMTWLEDDLSYVGQGPIADRSKEHLGPSDVGNILMRRIWHRELRSFAEGRPLKQWRRVPGAPGIEPTEGTPR